MEYKDHATWFYFSIFIFISSTCFCVAIETNICNHYLKVLLSNFLNAYIFYCATTLESVQRTPEEHQVSNPEAPREKSSPSVFVNSEPMREDQVQNAVKFLSHPKVRGSPVMYRRSFLERKGLTKEEIDEAFRRVPVSICF